MAGKVYSHEICGSEINQILIKNARYGNDERLTENYNKQLWADGGNY